MERLNKVDEVIGYHQTRSDTSRKKAVNMEKIRKRHDSLNDQICEILKKHDIRQCDIDQQLKDAQKRKNDDDYFKELVYELEKVKTSQLTVIKLKNGIMPIDYIDQELINMNILRPSPPRTPTPQIQQVVAQDDIKIKKITTSNPLTLNQLDEELNKKLEGRNNEDLLLEYSEIQVSLSTLSNPQLLKKLEKLKKIIEFSSQVNMAKLYQIIEDIQFEEIVSVETIELEIQDINLEIQKSIKKVKTLRVKSLNERLQKLQYALEFQKLILKNQQVIYRKLEPEPFLPLTNNELNILLAKDLPKYLGVIAKDNSLCTQPQYQNIKEQARDFEENEDFQAINEILVACYSKSDYSKHCSVKAYLEYILLYPGQIENPLLFEQVRIKLEVLKPPEDCKKQHSQLIRNTQKGSTNNIRTNYENLRKQNQGEYINNLNNILRKFINFVIIPQPNIVIIPQPDQNQKISPFAAYLLISKLHSFADFKEKILQQKIIPSGSLFRKLLTEILNEEDPVMMSEIFSVYHTVTQQQPDFKEMVTEVQMIQFFSPNYLKCDIEKLLSNIDIATRLRQKTVKISIETEAETERLVNELLQSIYYEVPDILKHIVVYLSLDNTRQWLICHYKNIITLDMLRISSLQHINDSITQQQFSQSSISDFLALLINTDFDILQQQVCEEFKETGTIKSQNLQKILYDLIKKRCTFGDFLTKLSINRGDQQMLFTEQTMITFLINNADPFLKTLIFNACSSFMPLPFVTYQQEQCQVIHVTDEEKIKQNLNQFQAFSQEKVLQNSIAQKQFNPKIYEELFYPFEKFKSILCFKLSSNQNKSPKGCTSMANFFFHKGFQKHSQTAANFGSIEIQFDYNFAQPMFIPVADAHGLVSNDILKSIYPLFDIFMIHILREKSHQKCLADQIIIIRNLVPKSLIIIIEQDADIKDSQYSTEIYDQQQNIIKVKTCVFDKLLDAQLNELKIFIHEHYMKEVQEFELYQEQYQKRIYSLEKFCATFNSFNSRIQPNNSFQKVIGQSGNLIYAVRIIKDFMEVINKNKENLHSETVLTQNYYFKQVAIINKQLVHDIGMNSSTCTNLRKQVKDLKQQARKQQPSSMTSFLNELISQENYIGLTSVISKILKSFLEGQLKPLISERTDLQALTQKQQIGNEQLLQQIKTLTQQIDQKYYSNEFLYREYYIFEKFQAEIKVKNGQPVNNFSKYLTLAKLQIQQGQPFEIIDGNNLQFVSDIYNQIYNEQDDQNILVVSVLGPQSSGKSLLLNILFGTQFQSSAGRCTKGIYGCLIEIKSQNKAHYKKILILDSEGIQNSEGRDEGFDKRIVFYLLCVSHVVLICNKGEMNSPMQEMIKIATDAISSLRDEIIQQPQVNIIMNMVPQIDEQSLSATIQNLTNAILEMNQQNNIQKLFTIDKNNVFMLPNAFASSVSKVMVVNQPSFQFASGVEKLRKKIIDYLLNKEINHATQYTLSTWFSFASKHWKVTDEYEGITEYSTLDERKLDLQLKDMVNSIIAINFENEKQKNIYEKNIIDRVKKILDKHGRYDQTAHKTLESLIDVEIQQYQIQVEFEIRQQFKMFCTERNIAQNLKQKRTQQLDHQIAQHIFGWDQIKCKMIQEHNEQRSKFIGDKQLQIAIQRYILDDSKTYSKEQAEKYFSKEWEKIEIELKKQQNKSDVQEQIFLQVCQLYSLNVKLFQNKNDDLQCFNRYQNNGQPVLEELLKQANNFFYFNGAEVRPNPEKYLNQQKKPKEYLMIKEDFYTYNKKQYFYDWERVVIERFKFDILEIKLIQLTTQINKSRVFGYFGSDTRNQANKSALTELIKKIQSEGQIFRVEFSERMMNQILYLEADVVQPQIQEQNKNIKIIMNLAQEIEYVKHLIVRFIKNMQSNISTFFQYQNPSNISNRQPNNFEYFDNNYKMVRKRLEALKFSDFQYKEVIITNPQDYQLTQSQKSNLQLIKDDDKVILDVKEGISNKSFVTYLKFLALQAGNDVQKMSDPVKAALKTLFEFLDKTKILKHIQNIVLETISRNPVKEGSTVDTLIAKLRDASDVSEAPNYQTLDYKLIQKTVSGINQIITKIDEEIEPYCLKVSEHGSRDLHKFAQIYISSILIEIKWIIAQSPLHTFQINKQFQKELFIAMLTSNDIEMDINQAKLTAMFVSTEILKNLKTEVINDFQKVINSEKDKFQLKIIVKSIENFLLSGEYQGNNLNSEQVEEKKGSYQQITQKTGKKFNSEQIVDFYVNPSKFLEQKFQEQWTNVTSKQIKSSLESFQNEKLNILQKFKDYFGILLNLLQKKECKYASQSFQIQTEGATPINTKSFKQIYQKALVSYFILLISNQWKQGDNLEIDKHILTCDIYLIHSMELQIKLSPDLLKHIALHLQGKEISNLNNFITQFLKCISQKLMSIQLTDNELIGSSYQDLRTKTLGCDQYCPLCRRQCDQDHTESIQDRIHKCEGGHQIQGFGGNRNKSNNQAITFGCHELQEDDTILWKDVLIKWSTFKNKMIYKEVKDKNKQSIGLEQRQWSFDEIQQGANQLHKQNNVKIWNLIGDKVCEYYINKGIPIIYTAADQNSKIAGSIQSILYILNLDQSASMEYLDISNGKSQWLNLTNAVDLFMQTFDQNLLQKNNSKVSIITYNTTANIQFDAEIPSVILSVNLGSPSGGTDFNPPLIQSLQLMQKHIQNFDSFVLCFMSDGISRFPKEAVSQIKACPEILSKLHFQSIAYGNQASAVLKPLAENFGGQFITVLEPESLSRAFVQLIPNWYSGGNKQP